MKRTNPFSIILMFAVFLCLSGKVFAQEAAFRATEVSLKPESAKYFKCPARVVFNGFITTNAAGVVKYKFVRRDEAESDVFALDFKKSGTMAVSAVQTAALKK